MLLSGVDAVIHLACASIGGRFTPDRKREIRQSRITPTRRLAELAAVWPPAWPRRLSPRRRSACTALIAGRCP